MQTFLFSDLMATWYLMGIKCVHTYWATELILSWYIWGHKVGVDWATELLFATPWTAARQASLSITNSWSLPKLMSVESVMPSNHLILCHPLLLLPSIFPSTGVFSNESTLCNKGQSTGVSALASILPKNTQDWFPLGLTGLISLQSKGLSRVFSNNTVQNHQFFGAQLSLIFQLSHPYMTTGKTIALTRQTFVSKVMFLLFNMLSRLAIAFFPRSKCVF